MTIAVVLDHVEEGWVASSADVRATAQGATRDEAVQNLVALVRTYPELIEEQLPRERQTRLVTV